MVRKYKRKEAYLHWKEEDLRQAISSVRKGQLSIRGAAEIFKIPFTTLQRRVQDARKIQETGMEDSCQKAKPPQGHPTLLSFQQERDLVEGLKSLSNHGFRFTPISIRRAVYQYAIVNKIKVPWSDETKMAGKDWFMSLIKRHAKKKVNTSSSDEDVRRSSWTKTIYLWKMCLVCLYFKYFHVLSS